MSTTPVLTDEFTVEIRKTRPEFRPFLGGYADLFEARQIAASLIASQGVEARVTDGDGRVWA
ncbi:hypothetical protein GCM10009840_18010 [Pseudolysinimonas kribbensis]|uniref:Uncharacterized protein n=1 Tax=Pseudolysinimonas kribbensis TaxID=433641 RepID=A0ABQ6K1L1_9MICO|nr:hypothetical protein [Pseudolysinimonas kribbensis]GMA93817.1 hypothetical protein GCM10025881_06410 [Pseudolysinimonas kribbensis]